MWQQIYEQIGRTTGRPFRGASRQPVAGGALNRAERLSAEGRDFFIKYRTAESDSAFAAEVAALREIRASAAVRVPEPLCWGRTDDGVAFLVLEYLELHPGAVAAEQLGSQLAALHRSQKPYFGWPISNTIGNTPQSNTPNSNWVQFWLWERLRAQTSLLAPRHGQLQGVLNQVGSHLPEFFVGYRPQPSLLHGDLWSGNYAADRSGQPVLFDPASYYGDREADLAMTELFGGFSPRFYARYRDAFPLDPGYETRRDLYNLYHILNHLHLFGEGYLPQAECLAGRLLRTLG